jgi:hypothetical protein
MFLLIAYYDGCVRDGFFEIGRRPIAIIFTFSAKPRPATGRPLAGQLPTNDRDNLPLPKEIALSSMRTCPDILFTVNVD